MEQASVECRLLFVKNALILADPSPLDQQIFDEAFYAALDFMYKHSPSFLFQISEFLVEDISMKRLREQAIQDIVRCAVDVVTKLQQQRPILLPVETIQIK